MSSRELIVFLPSGQAEARLALLAPEKGPARLAAQRLSHTVSHEFGGRARLTTVGEVDRSARLVAACPPWDGAARSLLRDADIGLLSDGRIEALSDGLYGDQGFVAARIPGEQGDRLLLTADTEVGLKNALLTLGDRLYRDVNGSVVVDPMEGVHRPAFERRRIKTDAMNCGPFRADFGYWDPGSASGVNEFADWLASFRLTDYDLLAFVRGWGSSYASDRFPALVDAQHPNPKVNYYPRLINRLKSWGMKVSASDIYIASGYSMETGTCPEMLSPCADASKLRPFQAGRGNFRELLHDPEAYACFAKPASAEFYAAIVEDVLEHIPGIDGLDFHIGHTFPSKFCRCPTCQGVTGNRDGIYRCFARVYETAIRRQPSVRFRTSIKMFGDATRSIAEHCHEFPQLEFFCWLRWVGNLLIELTDAPVTMGHEDGGGGLEANHSPEKTLDMIRDYWRDYEPWVRTYVQMTQAAGLPSFSWEPVLHKEIEHQFFLYSQLTWEPELSWGEFARRYVIRSERKLDPRLTEAYRLALEANASVTSWGLAPHEKGRSQRVTQSRGLLETRALREMVAELESALRAACITDEAKATPFFDLRRSLAMTLGRMKAGEALGQWH